MAHTVKSLLNGPMTKFGWSRHIFSLAPTYVAARFISCSNEFGNYNSSVVFKAPNCKYMCGQPKSIHYQPVRHAGHSHWHNIRHIKGAMDKIRAKHNIRITQKIRTALKDGGSTDPKLNRDLDRAFREGKSYNVPMSFMLETVKKMKEGKEKGSELIAEAKGHGNCLFMIECFTDKPARIRKELSIVLKKYGGNLVEAGAAGHMFNRKGVIYVKQSETKPLDQDKAEEIAIEVGAEEVVTGLDEEQQERLQFYCDPKELHTVKKALEEQELNITDARLELIPHTLVKLSEVELKVATSLLDAILELDEVIRVYDNIEAPEDNT